MKQGIYRFLYGIHKIEKVRVLTKIMHLYSVSSVEMKMTLNVEQII